MPVWRVSLWHVSHFCTFVDPVCKFHSCTKECCLHQFGAYLFFAYFSFRRRIVCVISLFFLSTCHRGYILLGPYVWNNYPCPVGRNRNLVPVSRCRFEMCYELGRIFCDRARPVVFAVWTLDGPLAPTRGKLPR